MSLKKNVVANFVGQGWTALMGIAFIPLYIKYLGVEAYGLIGFFAVMQAWFTLLDMGITQTLNREMARYSAGSHTTQSISDLLRSLEVISVITGLLICLIVWSSSHWIATFWLKANALESTTVANALTLMGVVIALRFIEGVYRGALLGLQHQVSVNVINIIFATLRFAVVIAVLHFYKASIEVFFVWQAICSFLSIILFAFFVYKAIPSPNYSPKFSTTALLQVKSFAKGVMGITFLALLLTQVDKILLSNLLSLKDFGFYTLATTLAGGLALITTPTTQAIYPKLVEHIAIKNTEALIKVYHQGAQLVSVMVIPIAIVLMLFGEQIISIWSKNDELALATAPILFPFALGTMLNCLVWMPYQLQLAYGWTHFALKVNTYAVFILVPSIYFLTIKYGAAGAAWAWAILNVGYVIISMHFMYKKLIPNEKWSWYWDDIILQLASAVTIVYLAKQLFIRVYKLSTFSFIYILLTTLIALFATMLVSNQLRPKLLTKHMRYRDS